MSRLPSAFGGFPPPPMELKGSVDAGRYVCGPYLASGIESIMEVWRPISRCGRQGCENLPEKESHPQITRARLRRTREQISD